MGSGGVPGIALSRRSAEAKAVGLNTAKGIFLSAEALAIDYNVSFRVLSIPSGSWFPSTEKSRIDFTLYRLRELTSGAHSLILRPPTKWLYIVGLIIHPTGSPVLKAKPTRNLPVFTNHGLASALKSRLARLNSLSVLLMKAILVSLKPEI